MATTSPPIRPVSGRPVSGRIADQVSERMLKRIASGEWCIGQRLPGERQLAEEMGVSRVSIRAALQTLKTQGFVDAVQGGGTRVISNAETMDPGLTELVRVSHANLYDLVEIRGILEVWAVRRAAEHATPAHISQLSEILSAAESGSDNSAHKAGNDIRFHLTIAKAAGSGIYTHLMGTFREILGQMLDYHRTELFTAAGDDATIQAHHRAIFDGIRTHDPHKAAEAMKHHLEWVLNRYRETTPHQ